MNKAIRFLFLALGLCALGSISFAQTVLHATFEADRLGLPPAHNLSGPPGNDELLYLGSGSYVSVVPGFPILPGRRAMRLSAPAEGTDGLVELTSAPLSPGSRTTVHGSFIGLMPAKGRLLVTISRDSSASLFALELSDGNVFLQTIGPDGVTRDRITFGRYTIGRAHEIVVDVDVWTGKSRITFQEDGGGFFRSPTFLSADARAIGNARTLSYVFDYASLNTPGGYYLLDEASLWVNRP